MRLGPKQKQWLAALESGEFRQAYETLHSCGGFCCLGVAAHLFVAAEWEPATKRSYGYHHGDRFYTDFLAPEHLSMLGISPRGADLLVSMNDRERLTFSEIAAEVRADPGYFFERSA